MRSTEEDEWPKFNKDLTSPPLLSPPRRKECVGENINAHTSNLPGTTALSCASEPELRVPCYCEENVWRLAFRRIHDLDASIEKSDAKNTVHEDIISQHYVVFISNEQRCCPMMAQRASKNPKEACFWDYHVIFVKNDSIQLKEGDRTNSSTTDSSMEKKWQRTTVFDVDSHLTYGCELEAYLETTFSGVNFDTKNERDKYAPLFRVIPAELYLEHFYSDRMHMYNVETKKWNAPPPDYDCIMNHKQNPAKRNEAGNLSNLDDYVGMKSEHAQEDGTNGVTKPYEMPSVFGEVLTSQFLLLKFGRIDT